MKKFFLFLVLAASFALTSCSKPFDDSAIWEQLDEYGESIRDHEQRISALEELCKQMNTNISSLQTIVAALQNNDYVTAIVPVIKDGITIGYTITFTKSQPITIYHGEDGKDGANGQDGKDGKDGYTPQIGVKQDTDGIYYWTLDGEWLLDASGNKIKAVGTDGKDGQNGTDGSNGNDGQNGSDGKDGQDGKDGADGITPQLKIEDGYWYISYDNGTTWTQLGKATGEDGKDGQDGQNGADGKDGQDGTNGKDGDSFFQSVTQDDDFVYFTLADGTVITLPKYKEEVVNENCKIYYTTLDGKKMFPKTDASLYGAILISNTYKDGQGVLTFDDVITSIGDSAFNGCTSLTSVIIPNSVTSIGYEAFSGCSSLTSITIPNSVTEIGQYAFRDCTGELIVNCNIPSASKSSYGAFYASKFTKVTIGEGVTSIGNYAFSGCSSLTRVDISDLSAWCKIDFATYIANPLFHANNLYLNSTKITELTIPSDITEIKQYAFNGCSSLTSVTIPDSVTSIGDYTFQNCTSLTSVTIGNSVTSIGWLAFFSCSSLTSVTIGNSVTSIGNQAFAYCTSLKEVYYKGDLSAWCKITFDYVNSNPCYNGAKLFIEDVEVVDITIPSDITKIKDYTFRGCSSLTSVTIPDSVTSIGYEAFRRCTSLTAFYGKFASADNRCLVVDGVLNSFAPAGLTEYTIPDNITSIGDSTFRSCTSLTSITIPDSVTSIGNEAFSDCTSLTSVTIPDSVTSIGEYAFYDCTSLKEIYCKPTTPPAGGSDMFSYTGESSYKPIGCKIYVPRASVQTYKSAKYWSYYTSYIEGYDF